MELETEEERKDRISREWWLTLLALVVIGGAVAAGLWLVSFYCLSQPTSPLNLSKWQCGGWSGFLVIGILAAGVALTTAAWRAINRKR